MAPNYDEDPNDMALREFFAEVGLPVSPDEARQEAERYEQLGMPNVARMFRAIANSKGPWNGKF